MRHKIARFLKWFSISLAFWVISMFGLPNFTTLHVIYPKPSQDIIHIWETTSYEDMWEGYASFPKNAISTTIEIKGVYKGGS